MGQVIHGRHWHVWLVLFPLSGLGAQAQKLELPPEFSVWQKAFFVRATTGYKDNVALSSIHPKGSAFGALALDASVFRMPIDTWQFNAFATFSDQRYASGGGVDREQMGLAMAQFNQQWGRQWSSATLLQYAYQKQAFDIADTRVLDPQVPVMVSASRIEAQMLTARQAVRREIQNQWVEIAFSLSRQILSAPLDDYWQWGPQLAWGWNYRPQCGLSLSYQLGRMQFDHHQVVALDGTLIPGRRLEIQTHVVELAWQQALDRQHRWQNLAKFTYERDNDNGPGFYHLRRYSVSEQLRYRIKKWEFSASARVSHATYDHQQTSTLEPLTRTSLGFGVRIEKQLTKALRGIFSYEHERAYSTQPYEDYRVNTISLGLDVGF